MNPSIMRDELAPVQGTHLKEYLRVIRRRKLLFIQVFVLVVAIGAAATLLSKPVYQTEAKILIPGASTTITFSQDTNPLSEVLKPMQVDSIPTQLQLMQEPDFQNRAFAEAQVKHPAGVHVSSVRDTNVISVVAEGENPKEIADLANTVVRLHLAKMDDQSSAGLRRAISWVTKQQGDAKQRLKEAEQQLIGFRQKNRIVQASTQQEARIKEFLETQSKAREAEANVTSTQAQIAQLRAELSREKPTIDTPLSRENTRREKLQEKLDDYQSQRQELLRDFQEDSDPVKALDQQIGMVQAELNKEQPIRTIPNPVPNPVHTSLMSKLAELESSLQGYIANRNAFQAKQGAEKAMIDDVSPAEVRLASLTQERDAAQADYNTYTNNLHLLQTRENAPMRRPMALGVAPVPGTPIRPHRTVNLAMTIFVALGLATGMVFLQEYLDDRLNSPDDLEQISVLPSLAHVPLMPPTESRLVSALPANSHVAESYRALRASIGFAGVDTPIRRLQVTSASKGEGKSVTALNLATAMAMDGKRVILVDGDMRRPSLHRMLNQSDSPGLSELLVGMRGVDEVVRDTETENLQVLCAGAIPPNPAELLGSQAFDQIMTQLEERADIVVIDSPPCMPVTDPLIIAPRMDGVLIVVHAGNTRKAGIKHVENLLRRARARVLGVVFNQVQADKGGYYYYNYYYYYGDGYYSQPADRKNGNGKSKRRKLPLGIGSTSERDGEEVEKV